MIKIIIHSGGIVFAEPFFGGGLGIGIIEGGGESATKFAWNIKTGVKINTGKAVSFKLNT
jgi:hypothetical protein